MYAKLQAIALLCLCLDSSIAHFVSCKLFVLCLLVLLRLSRVDHSQSPITEENCLKGCLLSGFWCVLTGLADEMVLSCQWG